MLKALRAFVATSFFLELVRQVLRWAGVWLMTLGVPDQIATLTTHEDVIAGAVGFAAYLVADGGWLVAKWRQFQEWRRAKWAR